MATKMTLRDSYNELSALVNLAVENGLITSAKANEHITFINGRLDILAKKNATTGDRKMTKEQIANEALRVTLLERMALGTIYTATELIKLLPKDSNGEPLSLPKVTSLLQPMVTKTAKGEINPNGTIERIVEKGKTYFRKLDLEATEENEE
jgi:hypothetical protein